MPIREKDGFAVVTPGLMRHALAQKLIRPVDRIRDIATRLGARPYVVRLVRTRWSGSRRGEGMESLLTAEEILPTPKVIDLNTLSEVVTAVGPTELGLVQLQQVSGRYTEDYLTGVDPAGNPPAATDDSYYEIEFFRPDGQPAGKHRFALASTPFYAAARVQWVVTLDAQVEKRRRDGRPRP
jgi:hypothetical protein